MMVILFQAENKDDFCVLGRKYVSLKMNLLEYLETVIQLSTNDYIFMFS